MNLFSVIEVTDPQWSKVVARCKAFDFYHTLSYNQLEKNDRPVLLLYEFGSDCIAFPLLLRAVPEQPYFDTTSVYGYAGPISTLDFDVLPSSVLENFHLELMKFFKEQRVVSAFSRLHPLLKNEGFFAGFGMVESINKTVVVDLTLSLEAQKKQYRKSNKSELNQLRKKGFEVVQATSKEDIDAFILIYHETMHRVSASAAYFFDAAYFYEFLNNPCFESKLLLAKFNGEVAAGAIFTVTNTIMQYHLAGTTERYIKETPMKLILDEARLLGNALGLHYLHLGGGVGGSDEDSLFRFKSGFSEERGMYKVWKMVVNAAVYEQLVEAFTVGSESTFFPKYRAPKI